ncbi:MAG: TonB-dependent receptor [Cytophagaceae bacterium]|nr:TonB-dependent receptor [Cytophagaceae bacterium]
MRVLGFAPERFLTGQKSQPLDSAATEQGRYQTLADWLGTQAPVAFKSYGPGQVTTAGLRGTSGVHTAVLWNGVNINSPALGLTDFSTIAVAGLDRLSVQYGAAASALGSGAVGGSLLLQTLPDWTPGWHLSLGQRLGSFQNHQSQGVLRYTTAPKHGWQLSGKTAAYGSWQRNQTPYTQRRGYPVEPSETQQRGFLQDIFLKNQRQQQVSLNLWLTDNRATLAPADPVGRELLRTQAARLLAGFETKGFSVKTGFIRDVTDYGKGATSETNPSRTVTDRWLLRAEHERTFTPGPNRQATLRLGAELTHFIAQVDEYTGRLIRENRADLYALFRYRASERLLASVNLRQAFVTGFNPPPTPSLGAEYRLIFTKKNSLSAKSSLALSYRTPTLNERYWKILGNPGLRPEQGFNKELGAVWQHTARATASLELTAFHNQISNWTYWNPERGYRVENLQDVLARGLEVTARWQRPLGKTTPGFYGQYALTRSTQQRPYDAYSSDIVGKQLPYIPRHSGTATAYLQRGRSRFTGQLQAASYRFVTFDNSQFQGGYVLVNLLVDTALRLNRVEGRLSAQAFNVFDTLVLSVKSNALPGRSFAVNLTFNLFSNPI